MRRVLLTIVSIALLSAALTGCKASADVDPHGSTDIGLFR